MPRDYLQILYDEFLEHSDATRVSNADAVKVYQNGLDCSIALIESGVENHIITLVNSSSLEVLKALAQYLPDTTPLKYGYCVEHN